MKVDLKINYLELENIAENVGKYKKAIEDINDAIENLDKVIQKQKSKSTKKLESKISNKKTKRSDLIDELDDIQKIIKDYCEDMRNLVNCKSEGTITRVDQFDIQFNIWQIAGDLTTFIGQMTKAPVEPPTPISVGPSNENNQRKMKANYNKLLSFHRSHIVPTYRLVDDYIDRLNKIYDKNIAPYENLDDDYESKMASIYHRGKSWTQIAEDWLFDHKGEIVTFCKSFAIAFLTTCTLMVIAAAISVSAPIVFTVFGILVAAGQCTISCMPQSAFENKWLKGIKDSSDSYVDGLNEKWKAFSDRGIYGVLECIGQDIGDASQTGKGLASITGSITGSIAGGFTGDKLSLKVKKAKAARVEAKSLKISETKEPELKDVEGEKPKVSKVDEAAEVTSKAGKITKGVSKVDETTKVASKAGKITKGGSNSIRDLMLKSESSKKWGILDDGTNQGVKHFADYWERYPERIPSLEQRLGVNVGDFSNSLEGFENFTKQAERVIDDAVANGNVRNINGKSIYYMDGIANPKKGVVVIVKDGKIQSMMPSDFKSFNKLQ